jgi:hypothetical protein
VTRWLWAAPDGSITDLSDWAGGMYVLDEGTTGELAPEYAFASQAFAGVDGAALQQITPQPRTLVLAVDMNTVDAGSLRARVRSVAHVLRPRAGIGTVQAVDDAGGVRSLPCYYSKGLEAGTFRATRYKTALQFWAPSPWWRGTPLTYTYSLAAPTAFFPFPPLVLSATTIAGTATFDLSDTDAPTYPTWTVTGPGSQLTLTNSTTGQSLTLNAAIGDGRTVTIDTRPGYQSVRRDDGTNLFGSLASDPALWPLLDAVNAVSATLTNAGAASRIALSADRLYSGAR